MDFKKKTRLASILALVLSLSLTHCELLGLEEDDSDDSALFALLLAASSVNGCASASPIDLSGEITSSITVQCGVLRGTVFVRSPAVLTIPAGGQIFGADGSSLFILQGAQLNAVGTAAAPVVFSSAQAAGNRRAGDWGGIVMIGNATTNRGANTTEGTNPQNYGTGTNDADSSGNLTYVRIEYAGDTVAPGNELNCLSMYGVGSGTTLNFVQCHKGRDDSFEWFGGAVNGKFLVSTGVSDDDFDMDEGYHGKLQHLLGYKFDDGSAGVSANDGRGFEFDGSASASGGSFAGKSTAKVANFTLVGPLGVYTDTIGTGENNPNQMLFREGTTGNIAHGYITGFPGAANTIYCDDDTAPADGTNLAIDATVITQTGTSFSNNGGSTCTDGSTKSVPATGIALTAAADEQTGTAPNLVPTVTVTGQPGLTTRTGFTGDTFFDNTTYSGAVDPAGTDWTAGWTNWLTN
ncbi:MAG: hypothetical protein NXI24_11130 [bacterium]|nr:hypothetical protein [bacterium]